MSQGPQADRVPAPSTPAPGARRWLLFVHQLPSQPSNLTVTTWRRLQLIGAIPLKQAVYVLPDTSQAREDFEWLKAEVKGAGGDASVFAADNVDAWSEDALVEEFRRARQDAYEDLARDVAQVVERASSPRRRRGTRAPALNRLLDIFRQRLAAIDGIDFFWQRGPRPGPHTSAAPRGAQHKHAPTRGTATGLVRRAHRLSRTTVDYPPASRRRSHGVCVVDSPLHRSAGPVRLRSRSSISSSRGRAVRHVRRRVQPPGRRLHVRNAVLGVRHRRAGPSRRPVCRM